MVGQIGPKKVAEPSGRIKKSSIVQKMHQKKMLWDVKT